MSQIKGIPPILPRTGMIMGLFVLHKIDLFMKKLLMKPIALFQVETASHDFVWPAELITVKH